jgi:hypothetical protein
MLIALAALGCLMLGASYARERLAAARGVLDGPDGPGAAPAINESSTPLGHAEGGREVIGGMAERGISTEEAEMNESPADPPEACELTVGIEERERVERSPSSVVSSRRRSTSQPASGMWGGTGGIACPMCTMARGCRHDG